ncbi:MAG TPA: hypothetical protein HA255_07030 [Methanosphaera sp.]|nr:hypothetical protein [Methanosphaera sp.]
MKHIICDETTKPDDWPASYKEETLEEIWTSIEKFEKDPNANTKELILALTANYDLNQASHAGLFRISDYEVGVTNSLFFYSLYYNIPSIKFFIYDIIEYNARIRKFSTRFLSEAELYIENYKGLYPSLKLFYLIYLYFNLKKNKTFCDEIIEFVNQYIETDSSPDSIDFITHAFTQMIRDLSEFNSKKINTIFAFTREELYKLYSLQAKLLKLNNDSIQQRDLRATLIISISSYILKSRKDYNNDYICKYISPDNVIKSFSNGQIWIREIKALNDEREQKVLPELFGDSSWLEFNWANNIDLSAKRQYFVSSFCKNFKSDKMREKYGECVYGFKNDRIIELIAPIIKNKDGIKYHPMLAQVIAFDVLYDTLEMKNEINYLCKIIDLFDMSDKDKKNFLQEIMQYWILSIKDPKWSEEQERRYVIFQYQNIVYKDSIFEDGFLKIKTSLFHYPDFILGNNPVHSELDVLLTQKRNAISMKEYMHCNNCLSNDFDEVLNDTKICPICGSKEYIKVSIRNGQ